MLRELKNLNTIARIKLVKVSSALNNLIFIRIKKKILFIYYFIIITIFNEF